MRIRASAFFKFVLISILLHSQVPAVAQELTPEQVALLSIDELAQVVIVASKREETVQDAPGIVSVLSKEEIRNFGARTLFDLLNQLPSIYMLGSFGFPQNLISIRGDNFAHFNTRVLLLIDGRPLREMTWGGKDPAILLGFPIDAIERLEVVRGPGSVLYGSNAFNGAINIITRKGEQDSATKLSVGGGSFNSRGFNLSGGNARGEFSILGSVHGFKERGWRFEATDEAGVHAITRFGEENIGVLSNLQYKKLTLSTFFGRSVGDDLGTTPKFPSIERTQYRYFLDIGHPLDISENLTIDFHTTYNRFERNLPFESVPVALIPELGPAPNSPGKSESVLFEAITTYNPIEKVNIVFGPEAIHLNGFLGDPPLDFVKDYDEWWYRAYFQSDIRLNSWLKLFGGLQWNKVESLDSESVLRFGANIDLAPQLSLKLLYGEAYRAPFALERLVDVRPTLVGNQDLQSETVTTTEAQLFYRRNSLQAALTAFNIRQKDIIGRIFDPTSASGASFTFVNAGRLEFNGFELEFKYFHSKRLFFTGSATYQENENQDGLNDFTLMPNWMGKLGFSYELSRGITFSAFNTYVGDAEDNILLNPARLAVNPDAKAYHLLRANLIFDINSILKRENNLNTTFRIYGSNLLDEDIHLPEFTRRNINTLPLAAGRSVFAEVSIEF